MSEFPKIARERLQQQSAPVSHPDPDLLAAFAEQSLPAAEGERVLAHLAVCADCRKVVALAFPTSEQPAPAATSGDSRAWHEWWVFRWAGLSAALVVILIAVYFARPRPRVAEEAAAPEKPSNAIVARPVPSPVPPPAATIQQKGAPRRELAKKSDANGVPLPPRRESSVVANAEPRAQNAPTTANETLQFRAVAPAPAPRTAKSQAESGDTNTTEPQVRRTPMVSGAVGGMLARTPAAPAAKTRTVSATSRWSISESGRLQRSDDGGRTWNNVEVAGAIGFRAVAAAGPDIWAGGAKGALFHSRDAGDHWTRIPIRTQEGPNTADISRIDLTAAGTVQVLTSTGEIWATSDAGATWTLVPDSH